MLPRFRASVEFAPSPDPERPGAYLHDRLRLTRTWLIVPPALVPGLACFDGRHAFAALRERLAPLPETAARELADGLDAAGFLETEGFERMRVARLAAFVAEPTRRAAFAGSGYPGDPEELARTLRGYLAGHAPAAEPPLGVAAPHVSPHGGIAAYGAAYAALAAAPADRVFVVLGTSHYGAPDRFGLTRKRFATPLGLARTAVDLVDALADEPAVEMEDYCHAVEHAIEFQVLFLQLLFGADVRVLPILCGPFRAGGRAGGVPEDDPGVASFLAALRRLFAREGDRLRFALGVDMAHVGGRYGDAFATQAGDARATAVAERDARRVERIAAGDAAGFWKALGPRGDELRWCGASPFYAFLRAMPQARGALLRYGQWSIDDRSLVGFAGMAFTAAADASAAGAAA